MGNYPLIYLIINNFLFSLFLINILFIDSIYSYYIFPFKYLKSNLDDLYKIQTNLSKEEIYLNYVNSISIYTIIEINNNIYEMFFKSKGKCSFLTNDSCISNLDEIKKQNHINVNISKIFDIININNNITKKCIKGEIGLALPGYASKSVCLPIINEIKECDNSITTQVWSINYNNSSQNKDFDGEIIIGIEPHDYNPSIYKEEDYYTIYNHINEDYYNDEWITNNIGFSLEFEKVYFYNNSHEDRIEINAPNSKEASLEFDLGMIKCPFVYYILIKQHFFQKYINLNICKEIIFSEDYYTFVCDINQLNNKLSEFYKLFPSIYFFSYHLNYTFILNANDLFLQKDDKLYFMIFSKNENINNWRIGEIFLKKYFFTFNHESKKIGFYIKSKEQQQEQEQEQKKEEIDIKNKEELKINYSLIILLIGVILLILEIGFCFYCCHKGGFGNNRKKRANELADDNYDYQTINNN